VVDGVITFFCFQPIQLSHQLYTDILTHQLDPLNPDWVRLTSSYTSDCQHTSSELDVDGWVNTLKKITHYELYYLPEYEVALSHKKDELLEKLQSSKGELNCLPGFSLVKAQCHQMLCFDESTKLFFIINCFAIKQANTSAKLDVDSLKSLYSSIRGLFVLDPANNVFDISDWAISAREEAVRLVSKQLSAQARYSIGLGIQIPDNTGYILTVFPDFTSKNLNQPLVEFNTEFALSNHSIDVVGEQRHECDRLAMSLNGSDTFIFFGWRHSTVFGVSASQSLSLLPSFINLQSVYFVVHYYFIERVNELFDEIRYETSSVRLNDLLEKFDHLVERSRYRGGKPIEFNSLNSY
jgi:hypothetical protein